METETITMADYNDFVQETKDIDPNAAATLAGLAMIGLMFVGTYVVAKKATAKVKSHMQIRREMKKLYKEHTKQKSA